MTRNTTWVAPRPSARGAISTSARRACGSPRSTPRPDPGADPAHRRHLDEQVAGRADDHADGEARRRPNTGTRNSAPADDPEVVDERRDGRRAEPAPRVEDAGRHRAGREEQRRRAP